MALRAAPRGCHLVRSLAARNQQQLRLVRRSHAMKQALHLCTTNDRNGNPRRLFAIVDGYQVYDVLEEGYEGEAPLQRNYPDQWRAGAVRIEVSVTEYKRWRTMPTVVSREKAERVKAS